LWVTANRLLIIACAGFNVVMIMVADTKSHRQPHSKRSVERKQYSAPALQKGLDILELLAVRPKGLNASDIAAELGRSIGEVFRMLMVLEQRKYVALQAQTDQYVMTLKMFKLSHQFAPLKRLTIAAGPVMEKLATNIDQSCHLVVYYNGEGLVVAQKDGPGNRCYGVRLGSSVPLYDTCSGSLFLAFGPEKYYQAMLSRLTPEQTRQRRTSDYRAMIDQVREHGFERRSSHQVQGVYDMGFPVFDSGGMMIASLTIPFLEHIDGSHSVHIDEAQQHLEKSAAKLSSLLGYGSGR
jgi:DNA-binding IclR family transcriptional regulator